MNSPRRTFVFTLFALASLTTACGAGSVEGVEPDYLHVVIDHLPQCEYGVGYERPLRIELIDAEGPIATTFHSGIYMGEASIQAELHVPNAYPGRYRLRFGQCPSLLDAPLESVACEDVRWVRGFAVHLEPAGFGSPQTVFYDRLPATCLQPGA